jgi:hypothetical protein
MTKLSINKKQGFPKMESPEIILNELKNYLTIEIGIVLVIPSILIR